MKQRFSSPIYGDRCSTLLDHIIVTDDRGSRPLSTGIGVLHIGENDILDDEMGSRPLSTGIGVLQNRGND